MRSQVLLPHLARIKNSLDPLASGQKYGVIEGNKYYTCQKKHKYSKKETWEIGKRKRWSIFE
jgi:hypothetical protein